MPQLQKPKFHPAPKCIAKEMTVELRNQQVVYFSSLQPVFQHAEDDLRSFRMFTSTLIDMGEARQVDIVEAFEVPLATVKRYLKVLRVHGKKGFFTEQPRRSAAVLNDEMRLTVERLIAEGKTVPEVAKTSGVKANTLHKAMRAGRLTRVKKKNLLPPPTLFPLKANVVRTTAQP